MGSDGCCSVGHWLDLTRGFVEDGARQIAYISGRHRNVYPCGVDGISPIPEIAAEFRDQATALHQELGGAGFRVALAEYDPCLPNAA